VVCVKVICCNISSFFTVGKIYLHFESEETQFFYSEKGRYLLKRTGAFSVLFIKYSVLMGNT